MGQACSGASQTQSSPGDKPVAHASVASKRRPSLQLHDLSTAATAAARHSAHPPPPSVRLPPASGAGTMSEPAHRELPGVTGEPSASSAGSRATSAPPAGGARDARMRPESTSASPFPALDTNSAGSSCNTPVGEVSAPPATTPLPSVQAATSSADVLLSRAQPRGADSAPASTVPVDRPTTTRPEAALANTAAAAPEEGASRGRTALAPSEHGTPHTAAGAPGASAEPDMELRRVSQAALDVDALAIGSTNLLSMPVDQAHLPSGPGLDAPGSPPPLSFAQEGPVRLQVAPLQQLRAAEQPNRADARSDQKTADGSAAGQGAKDAVRARASIGAKTNKGLSAEEVKTKKEAQARAQAQLEALSEPGSGTQSMEQRALEQRCSPAVAVAPQPWHLTGCFSSMQPIAPELQLPRAHWYNTMTSDPRVLSLDAEAMAFKYGKWFLDTYWIDQNSCIGIGSTATVCAGTRHNRKTAFKIMHQSKTAPNAALLLERSVLTELEVHQGLLKWRDHPAAVNLLGIVDCFMFPPFYPVFHIVEADSRTSATATENQPSYDENNGGDDFVDLLTGQSHAEQQRSAQGGNAPSSSAAAGLDQLTFQIIMVTPLCELGGFLKLCKGKTRLPTRAMCPECLRDVMHTLAPANYKTLLAAVKKEAADMPPDEVFARYPPTETAQELMDTWGKGHRAFMRVVDLSASWTTILKLQILLQVADGLSLLHEAGVVHCDVKLDNIFLTYDADARPFRISSKLGDLGMCRYMNQVDAPKDVTPGLVSTYTTLVKGTPGYCAPEMLEFGRIAPATDIYSFAVLASLALSTSCKFVRHDSSVLTLQTTFPDDMSAALREALLLGMHFTARKRPSLEEISLAMEEELGRVASTIPGLSSLNSGDESSEGEGAAGGD